MENHHAINGKIHYFDCAIFNCYVSSPEGVYIYIYIEPVSNIGSNGHLPPKIVIETLPAKCRVTPWRVQLQPHGIHGIHRRSQIFTPVIDPVAASGF